MTPRRPCIASDGKQRETRPVAAPAIYPAEVWWPLVNLTTSFTLKIEMLCNRLVRIARLLLFVLLSFAIPLAGYAGMGVPKMPCPMDATIMAEQQSMSDMNQQAMTPDCCNDMATRVKTGKTCKVGQDCKIGTLGLSVHLQNPTEEFSTVGLIAGPKDRAIESRLLNIWRPPA